MKNELTGAVFTEHSLLRVAKREISEDAVRSVLADPVEIAEIRPGRIVVHGIVSAGAPGTYQLLREFVDVDRVPVEIVTVYATSKLGKYTRLS